MIFDSASRVDKSPQRVLIIKPSSLGDIITAMPVLRGIARTFPGVHISWLVRDIYSSLIAEDADIDEIITYDRKQLGAFWRSLSGARHVASIRRKLRDSQFDWAIDLQGLARSGYFTKWTKASVRAGFADARELAPRHYNYRIDVTGTHTVDRNILLAKQLGIDARETDMTLSLTARARAFIEATTKTTPLKPGEFVICVPPSRWASKTYPVRHWKKVVSHLSRMIPVAILGSPDDVEMCHQIALANPSGTVNLCGKTSIDEFVGIISVSRGVICCDSAAKFIAQATDVDSVVLLGPTRIERTGPYPKANKPGNALVADIPCAGCLQKQCSHNSCMQMISPNDVIRAAEEMLSERS